MGLAVLAGLVAAGISWYINGKLFNGNLVHINKNKAVIYIGPAVEEISKTGFALLFGAHIVFTHITFGLLEGIWELYTAKSRVLAGFVAIISHMLFGLITLIVVIYAGVVPAVITAYMVHMLWNYWVIKKAKQ